MPEEFNKFKNEYQKIGHLYCRALSDEVYLNKHGLTHLFVKGRLPRKSEDIIRRIKIFPAAKEIIQKEKEIAEYRITKKGLSTGHFWTLKSKINGKLIKVVIRQLNNGRKHFFSIMDEN